VPHNTRLLMNWPNHLMEPGEVEDLFLLELIGLDPVHPAKGKSMLLLSMPLEVPWTLKNRRWRRRRRTF
jgi:hypothetical protein